MTARLALLAAALLAAVLLGGWALPQADPAGAASRSDEDRPDAQAVLVEDGGDDGTEEAPSLLGGTSPDDEGPTAFAPPRLRLPRPEEAGPAGRDLPHRGKSPTAHLRRGGLSPPDGEPDEAPVPRRPASAVQPPVAPQLPARLSAVPSGPLRRGPFPRCTS